MYPSPSTQRSRLACSPDSFFRLSPEICEPAFGRSSIPLRAMLDSICIPFALPLPLPIPIARVVPDSPNQLWWDEDSGHNAGSWSDPPLLAQASLSPPTRVTVQWPQAHRAPKSPAADFPIWDPVLGFWPLAACPRCMLEDSVPVVTSPDQMPSWGSARASVPPVQEVLSVPSSHVIEMASLPWHLPLLGPALRWTCCSRGHLRSRIVWGLP